LVGGLLVAGFRRLVLADPPLLRARRQVWLSVLVVLAGLALPTLGFGAGVAGAVAPGACGSVLLAGSSWPGGGGVDVKSNGSHEGTGASCGGTNTVNGVTSGSEWQCVELVNRLYLTKGWISSTWHGNGGESSATAHDSMYDEAPAGLSKQPNGSISSVGPGDVVSINEYLNGGFLADGHVLIVNTSGAVTSGTIPLVSQNSGDPSSATPQRTATLSNGTLTINGAGGGYTYSVIGVVHAPTSSGPPPPPPPPAYRDLAQNGGFEDGSASWQVEPSTNFVGVFQRSGQREGNRAQRVALHGDEHVDQWWRDLPGRARDDQRR
jgi:hypothetical protein